MSRQQHAREYDHSGRIGARRAGAARKPLASASPDDQVQLNYSTVDRIQVASCLCVFRRSHCWSASSAFDN